MTPITAENRSNMPSDLPLLFTAGFLGSVLNAIAGGGTFVTFPALLLVGLPPISANATNTFASCSGYISGAYGFRRELRDHRSDLPGLILISLLGGIAGAWLLLQTPERLFREAIPWLLLFATLVFIFGERLNRVARRLGARHPHAHLVGRILMLLMLLGVCVYGGFFNAGLGIIILSYLALAGHTDIHTMNGVKLLVSTCISLVAVALFIAADVIAWPEGITMLTGAIAGGYLAARISRRAPQSLVKGFVAIASSIITLYFFYDTYVV